jgi:hypothetical protein
VSPAAPATARTLFDFSQPEAVQAWYPIDDRVMGGASQSRLRHDAAGHAVFEGEVSLAGGGGFASVRSRPGPQGQAGAQALLLEVAGDGGAYKLQCLLDDGFDRPSYQAVFTATGPAWQTLRLPLAQFRASYRGREVHGAPPLDPAHIRQLGLLSVRRQPGPFALRLRRIGLG